MEESIDLTNYQYLYYYCMWILSTKINYLRYQLELNTKVFCYTIEITFSIDIILFSYTLNMEIEYFYSPGPWEGYRAASQATILATRTSNFFQHLKGLKMIQRWFVHSINRNCFYRYYTSGLRSQKRLADDEFRSFWSRSQKIAKKYLPRRIDKAT